MVVIRKYLYYDKRYNHYYICKRINGKPKYFGYYSTKDEALCRLNYLEAHNWNLHPKCVVPKKYYSYDKCSGFFVVQKKINGEDVYFDCFKSEDDAKKRVDYLNEHNWDLSLRNIKKDNPKYYYFNGYGFRILKCVDGRQVYYGTVKCEDDAKFVVDELRLVGWNWDLLSDSVKEYFI